MTSVGCRTHGRSWCAVASSSGPTACARLGGADLEVARGLGLRTVIDLRTIAELDRGASRRPSACSGTTSP